MVVELHQVTSALYLAAGLAAGVGLALPAPRLARGAVALLAAGAAAHGASFVLLHLEGQPPSFTNLPAAVSVAAWVAVLFFLILLRRARLGALVLGIAPAAFLGAFYAALRLPHAADAPLIGSASWPHAHVLLASAGLALLGVAGIAGSVYVGEHRRLKAKRPVALAQRLPSLEALDRVNVVALAVGFPLLTLGVLTGMLWTESVSGRFWSGSPHETWSAVAWAVYAVLVLARFGARQGARDAALSAVGGFAFLLFAVVGVGLLT